MVVLAVLSVVEPALAVDGADLSVGWISRLPQIDYVWASENPAAEGWPVPGEQVTWVAHVRNLSGRSLEGISYQWLLDGKVVESGVATLATDVVTTFELPRSWTFDRHELVFEIDTTDAVEEIEERNNRLLIHTDALTVGFWVEQTFWNSIREVLVRADIGATTFDDWMQRQVRRFNEMAALARYPETPDGVLDRWRIDAIHLVPDDSLPLYPPGPEVPDWGADPSSYPTLYPDSTDRSIDMQWGFPARAAPFFQDRTAWTLLYDSLIHELGHARYLVDVYGWDVSVPRDVVQLNPPPPATEFGWLHKTTEFGLMNTQWGFIDRYSAIALNRIAGQRATRGHYNEPANIGTFLNDLPEWNRVTPVTPDGTTFPRSRVRVYQASGERDPDFESHPYRLVFDGQPDLELETDQHGAVLLGRNPFSDGDLVLAVDRINVTAILEIIDDAGASHWGYLESLQFTLAYWRGQTEMADHRLLVDAPVCFNSLGPDAVSPHPEALLDTPVVTFEWPGNIGRSYELWYMVDGGEPRQIVIAPRLSNRPVSVDVPLRGKRVAWWILTHDSTVSPLCPAQRSSLFFFDLDLELRSRQRPVRR